MRKRPGGLFRTVGLAGTAASLCGAPVHANPAGASDGSPLQERVHGREAGRLFSASPAVWFEGLFAVPAQGGERRRLTEADANLLHPTVSPDGRWIAASRILHRREIRHRPLP